VETFILEDNVEIGFAEGSGMPGYIRGYGKNRIIIYHIDITPSFLADIAWDMRSIYGFGQCKKEEEREGA
jgi:hypothetical protein